MHIGKPTLVDRGDSVLLSANITSMGRSRNVWFALPADWARYIDPDCLDPFVVGTLPLALRRGEPVYSAGRLSARLLFALNTAVPALVAQTGTGFRPIQVRTAQAVDYAPPPPYSRAVAGGFTGSVDSFCVLADHFGPAVPPAHRLTHLFCHASGDARADRPAAGQPLLARVRRFARELHLPLIEVSSNLEEYHDGTISGTEHQFHHVAAILVLQKLVGTYLSGAGFRYQDCFARGADTTLAQWDPVLLPHLSTERLRMLSVCGQYSLVERAERVLAFDPSRRHLHVCRRRPERNCSVCQDCARTQLTLDYLGRIEDFRQVFDATAFADVRSHYMIEMLRSRDPKWIEIRDLARAQGRRISPTLRLAASLPPRMVAPFRRQTLSRVREPLPVGG